MPGFEITFIISPATARPSFLHLILNAAVLHFCWSFSSSNKVVHEHYRCQQELRQQKISKCHISGILRFNFIVVTPENQNFRAQGTSIKGWNYLSAKCDATVKAQPKNAIFKIFASAGTEPSLKIGVRHYSIMHQHLLSALNGQARQYPQAR